MRPADVLPTVPGAARPARACAGRSVRASRARGRACSTVQRARGRRACRPSWASTHACRQRGRKEACPARVRPPTRPGHGQPATARTRRSSLNGSRSSKLPPPRVSTITSTSGCAQSSSQALRRSRAAARGPWTYVSATSTFAAGKRLWIVAITSRFAAASLPVTSPILRGRSGSGRLRSVREESFACELRLQPFERGQMRTDSEALNGERAQPEVALLFEELGAAVDVHALAVDKIETQRVELSARHLYRDARAVGRILEREEDTRPAHVALQLGHLALDPDGGEPPEPVRDTAIEARDGVDGAVVVGKRRDLAHASQRTGQLAALEQDLGGRGVLAAVRHELDSRDGDRPRSRRVARRGSSG